MSAQSAHLTLRPDRCNECGKCVSACPNDAIRVGTDYILIDWHACNQCCACIEVCDRAAIQRTVVPLRSTSAVPSVAPADVSKVVVGSRAEAKAVRKAAEQAAKQAGRTGGRQTATARSADPAGGVTATAVVGGQAAPSARAGWFANLARRTTVAGASTAPPPAAWDLVGTAWTLVDALVVLAVVSVTLLGKNAVLGLPAIALMPATGRAFTRAGVLALYYAIQISALVLLAGRHGCTFGQAFGLWGAGSETTKPQPADKPSWMFSAGLTVALLVGVEAVAISYGLIAMAAGWKQPVTLSADVSTVFGVGGAGLALSVLLVAVVAPIAEELAFRGVILPAVGQRWGAWPAIAISAVLFAVYHVNLWLFVPMLALGVALGWLTVARRSLWPALALHVLYNTLAVVAAFIVPR